MIANWLKISLLYFIIAGILGVFLRYLLVEPVEGINYKFFLHTHSHVAFMGWVFNVLFAALIYTFLPGGYYASYNRIFVLLQVAVLGMLFTFPWEGYGLYSIIFSTLHILLSYWFAIKYYRDTRRCSGALNFPFSLKFMRWALLFMVLSSIGPFALGYIMAQDGEAGYWNRLAIYFYLHFQYNGWFTFAVLGLLCRWMEQSGINLPRVKLNVFLLLMAVACFPAFALSALWIHPPVWVYILAFTGAILQTVALGYGINIYNAVKLQISRKLQISTSIFWGIAMIAFTLKIIMQLAGAFPIAADLAFRFKHLTIGFLHLVFLGFVSLYMLGWIFQYGFFNPGFLRVKIGMGILIAGIFLSELFLFGQPLLVLSGAEGLEHLNFHLLIISCLIPLGVILIGHGQKKMIFP